MLVLTSMAVAVAASPAPGPSAAQHAEPNARTPKPAKTVAKTPTVSPRSSASIKALDITGHWTTDKFGDIDFVQKGANVTGTSPTGVNISGILTGRRLSFSFWRGTSYASATTENRGHGTMDVAADGKTATATWASEDPKGHYQGSFTLIKVGGGGGGRPSLTPEVTEPPATQSLSEQLQDTFVNIADNLLSGGDSDEDIAFGGVTFIIVWAANHPEAVPSEVPSGKPSGALPDESAASSGDIWIPLESLPPIAPFPSDDPPVDAYDVSPDDFSSGGE